MWKLRRQNPRGKYIPSRLEILSQHAKVLFHKASNSVAHNGAAHLARCRKPHLEPPVFHVDKNHRPPGIGLPTAVDDLILLVSAQAEGTAQSIRVNNVQPIPVCCVCHLGGQHLAATRTARTQDIAAILGFHAGTEAMHLGALALFGLIRTEHRINTLSSIH